MSFVQFAARFENLRDAYDDTLSEIEANVYPGAFLLMFFEPRSCWVGSVLSNNQSECRNVRCLLLQKKGWLLFLNQRRLIFIPFCPNPFKAIIVDANIYTLSRHFVVILGI
jgi:hypothetical protein